jgi:magnesium transporter
MRHAKVKQRAPTLGEPPGTLLPVGDANVVASSITLLEFSPQDLCETSFDSVAEGLAYRPSQPVLWLNVYGLHDAAVMQAIGERFGLHPLVQEDILSNRQRPKLEDYGDYLFIATRVFDFPPNGGRLRYNQMYLVIGNGFVLSFQEKPTGVFEPVRERLRSGRGSLRSKGADYLAYGLLDAIIDDYFGVLSQFTEHVERTDQMLLHGREQGVLHKVQRLKHDCLKLRRSILPLREILLTLMRGEYRLIQPDTQVYLRDAYDHTMHVIESLEMSREMVADMLDLYLSTQSHRLNLQMRVLTVFSMIFMPLTLIAGIYGMNFENMPELHWHYGYFAVLGLMAAIAAGLIWLFSRRNWI